MIKKVRNFSIELLIMKNRSNQQLYVMQYISQNRNSQAELTSNFSILTASYMLYQVYFYLIVCSFINYLIVEKAQLFSVWAHIRPLRELQNFNFSFKMIVNIEVAISNSFITCSCLKKTSQHTKFKSFHLYFQDITFCLFFLKGFHD